MMCLLRALLPTAGPTQSTQVVTLGRSILSKVRAAVLQLEEKVREGGEVDPKLTGLVWAACHEVAQASLTNAAAVGKEMVRQLQLMKDARQELLDAKEEGPGVGQGQEGERLAEMEEDEDLDEERLTVEEFARVQPAIELVTVAYSLTRLVYQLLLKGGGGVGGVASSSSSSSAVVVTTEWMEEQLGRVRELTVAVDSLSAAVLPPQSPEAVDAAATSTAEPLQRLLQKLGEREDWEVRFGQLVSDKDRGGDEATEASGGSSSVAPGVRWLQRCARRVEQLQQQLRGG